MRWEGTFKGGRVKGPNLRICLFAFGRSCGFSSITTAGFVAEPMRVVRSGSWAIRFWRSRGVIRVPEMVLESRIDERMVDFMVSLIDGGKPECELKYGDAVMIKTKE